VNDKAKGSGEWSVEFYLAFIFLSWGSVQLFENKWLHRIYVDNHLHKFIARVGKHGRRDWFLHVYALHHFEDFLPNSNITLEDFVVILLVSRELVDLSQHDTVKNLLRRWQERLIVKQMIQDHGSSWFMFGHIVPGTPIPCKPFKVFLIDESQLVICLWRSTWVSLPRTSIGSCPDVSLNSLDFVSTELSIFQSYLSCHAVEIDCSDG